jgi:polysaccharide export outer membrane protein
MRHARALILLVAVLAAGGCMRKQPVVAVAPPPPPSELDLLAYGRPAAVVSPGYEAPYTLDSGDKLRVVVYGQDGLSNSYAVDAAGNITMPLIGAAPARGHTPAQLSGEIAAKLRNGYIREPHVAVEVEAYRPFFILGEVTFPGQYPYVANMTVETAVAIAGGYTPRAFRQTVDVSRPSGEGPTRLVAPVTAPIRPGDTVVVTERWF